MFGIDIGIDLGTYKTTVYIPGKGVVLSEPSYVAYNGQTEKMLYAGQKAFDMIGREPQNITVSQPLVDGVISDSTISEQMVRAFLQRVLGHTIFKPNMIACMPSMITDVQKRTIVSVLTTAGAKKVCLLEEPLAAAMGAGVDITKAEGNMVIDIGHDTTGIAVVSMASMALTESVRTASSDFDEAIMKYIRKRWNVIVGQKTAEEIKKEIGCAVPREEDVYMAAKGRDALTGLPHSVEISSLNVLEALEEPLSLIRGTIRSMFERIPAELVGDISQAGIILTGGGSLLYGMEQLVKEETGITAFYPKDPENCVARGTGIALKKFHLLREYGYTFQTKEDVRVG